VNPNWIVLAVGVVGAAVMLATSRWRRDRAVDLGSVSHQWMAEQRLGQGHDSRR
jgi:hypothetical protein